MKTFLSPLLHADYLHLCLNIFGSYLVVGRFEDINGTRPTLVLLLATYFCQVILVAFTVYMTGLPIDILGISCLVYASLGHIVQQNFTRLSTTEKNSLVCALVLMVIFETSLRTIIVHGLAFTFGVALSVAKRQSKD
jgi:membrane associated rhomboid family serine protease